MKIKEIRKNIFELPDIYCLVHCISLDCKLGAGIAKSINEMYPDMKNKLIEYIKLNNINYPSVLGYNSDSGRIIFNLITKYNYWDKPDYITIKKSIEELCNIIELSNIKRIAMPKIGCGLDRLDWKIVKEIIIDIFKDTDIEIVVCYI